MYMTSIDSHGLFLIKINTTFANRQFRTFSSSQIQHFQIIRAVIGGAIHMNCSSLTYNIMGCTTL